MFTNPKKQQAIQAKPTLQDLVFLRRSKENECSSDRQPLAAIVKNNMNIRLSNINLENRKPIYQSMRSPSSSVTCTQLSRSSFSPTVIRRGSPSLNRSTHSALPSLNRSYLAGSPSFNRCNLSGSPSLNMSANKTLNNSMSMAENDSLEIHGSYFINKSILNSPSERSLCDDYGSFMTTIWPSVSRYPLKHSAESVVEALKQKCKRKRASAELLDESNMKKKKIDSSVDSTLTDLLQNPESSSIEHSTKSKHDDATETMVKSTGVQCILNEEETEQKILKTHSEKVPIKKKDPHLKYGLTQTQINALSGESSLASDTEKEEHKLIREEKAEEENKELSKQNNSNDSIRNISYDCSFKTVSFSDSTADKSDVKAHASEGSPHLPSLKLSALKNMESPYKRLFKNAHLKNITPESIKKMRKHPVYFSAKIDIDEIQQHCEEFGASGVSLKAFRLDKEEAIKRVDDIFDETDGKVDFKAESVSSEIIVTSVVSTTSGISLGVSSSLTSSTLLTSSSVKSNLFGLITSTAVSSTPAAVSTPSLTFGNLTSAGSLAQTSSVISVSSTETGFSLQGSIIGVTTTTTATTQTLIPSAASIAPTTFSFGTAKPAALKLTETSAPAPAVVLSSLACTSTSSSIFPQNASVPSGITFGAGGATTYSSTIQPSIQFSTLQKPSATLPSITSTILTNTMTLPVSLPATSNFGFNFQPCPVLSTNPPQSSTITVTTVNATVCSTGLFGSAITSAPVPSFTFGVTPSTGLSKDVSGTVSSTNSAGFSFAPTVSSNSVSGAAPVLSANPSLPLSGNIFGTQPTNNTFCNPTSTKSQLIFGSSTGTSTTASTMIQPSLFGQSSATTTAPASTQLSVFGGTSSLPSIPSLPSSGIFNPSTATGTASLSGNIFVSQNKPSGFSFTSTTTAASTGFPFSSSTAPTTGFPFSSTTTAASTGFSFTSTAAPTTFNFGSGVSSVANSFGPSNTPVTQNYIFGQTGPTSTSSQAPANIFGAPTSTAQNMFGAPASTAPTAQGIFGSATGSNATGSTFGSSTQNTFGASTNQNVFGAVTQQPSIFGDQSKVSGFNFGSAPAASSSSTGGFSFGTTTTTTNSVFGQSNVFGGSTTSNNVFAAPKPAENPNPFGQQPKPSGFDFSSSLSTAPALNFGGNVFGSQQPTEMPKPSFNFGSQQLATPTFGATPASPAFGNIQQPAFGSPQPFGAPSGTPGAGAGFTIGTGSSNPPPTRQTQRARRRLRR